MIADRLELAARYAATHRLFAAGFDFLKRPDLNQLPDGKHEISDGLFAMIMRCEGLGRDAARLEAHRRYIDIQYVVSGCDLMGWRPLADCRQVTEPYDDPRDLIFFGDRAESWLSVAAGRFVIFWPDDAHAPLAGQGPAHKVVLKVALDA